MRKFIPIIVTSLSLSGFAWAADYSTQPSYTPGTMQYQDQKTIDQKYIDHNLDRQREQSQLQQERLENQRLQNQRLETQRLDNQRNDQRVQDRRRDDARRADNYNPYNQNGIADASDPRMAQTIDKDSEEGRVIEAIKRDLKRDKSLSTNAQNVKISVNSNKVVTLTGNVDTKEERARVESIAKDAFGVRSVNNQLQVVSYDVAPAKK